MDLTQRTKSIVFASFLVLSTALPVVTFSQSAQAQSYKDLFEFAQNPKKWFKGNIYWIVGEAVVYEQLTRCDRDPNLCRSKVFVTNKAIEKITGICQTNNGNTGRFIADKLSTKGPRRKGVNYVYQYHDNNGYYFVINTFVV